MALAENLNLVSSSLGIGWSARRPSTGVHLPESLARSSRSAWDSPSPWPRTNDGARHTATQRKFIQTDIAGSNRVAPASLQRFQQPFPLLLDRKRLVGLQRGGGDAQRAHFARAARRRLLGLTFGADQLAFLGLE